MPDPRALLNQAVRYERGGALDKALDAYRAVAAEAQEPGLRSEAYRHEADVHRTRCDWDAALSAARTSGEIAEQASLVDLYAEALNAEAAVYQAQGELDLAVPLLRRMLEVAVDERVRGIAWQNLGYVAAMRGDIGRAREHFDASLECFRRAGYERGEVIALANYARAALDQGDPEQAYAAAEQAVQRARRIGDLELLASATINEAEALAEMDELYQAAERASAALGHFVTVGNAWKQVECFRLLGQLYERRAEVEVARRCYRQGRDLAERIGAKLESEQLGRLLDRLEA